MMDGLQLWYKRGDRYGDWYMVQLGNNNVVTAATSVSDGEDADRARRFGFLSDGMLVVDMNNHRDNYQPLLKDDE